MALEFELEYNRRIELLERKLKELTKAVEDQLDRPVRMLLYCFGCWTQHIDKGEWASILHRTHLCENCGRKFRPAHIYTVGVAEL